MPYKAKHILDRGDGWEVIWFLSLYFLQPIPPGAYLACQPGQVIDSTERIIWEEQRWDKSSGHPNNIPTRDPGMINVPVACKLATCLSGFVI